MKKPIFCGSIDLGTCSLDNGVLALVAVVEDWGKGPHARYEVKIRWRKGKPDQTLLRSFSHRNASREYEKRLPAWANTLRRRTP